MRMRDHLQMPMLVRLHVRLTLRCVPRRLGATVVTGGTDVMIEPGNADKKAHLDARASRLRARCICMHMRIFTYVRMRVHMYGFTQHMPVHMHL